MTGVVSENHPDARIERRSGDAFVARLARSGAGLERDLALRWQTRAAATDLAARAVRATAGAPAYLEARFALNADPNPGARPPTDVILVVDSSLSMAGEPLARAVALADAVAAQAQPADRVALVTFATGVTTTGFAPAASFDRARLRALIPGGHSNLEAALDEAAELARGARNPVVVLMTDGQPTAGALEPAARAADFAAAHVVVACFNYPSRKAWLETLLPHAQTRFVPDGPAGETAVKEIARLANAPVLEDVALEIDAPGLASRAGVVPARLAVGESARILARVAGDATLRVTGTMHGAPVVLTARVAVPEAPDAGGDRGLPVEWARLHVRDLERVIADKPDGAMAIVAREEIKALGKSYGLVTRFTSFVATDSVSPDDVKPGDPELRVRAPRAALGVRGVLPWGETVECAWQEDEGLWLGRFLIPRGTPDGLYKLRVFVDEQAGTTQRGVLFVRVDSKPPELVLTVEGNRLVARPKDARAVPARGDSVVRDELDVKRVVVFVAGREVPLVRRGPEEVWDAVVELPPGVHMLRMVVTDPAGNSSESAVKL